MAQAIQDKSESALATFQEFAETPAMSTLPTAIIEPLQLPIDELVAAQTAAKSVLHAKLEDVLSLTLPDIKAVVASVAAGKRAISLCSSTLSAVAKAAARR